MMTQADIRAQFDRWIEFPKGSDQMFVTTTSTLLFAEHIAEMAARSEREARQAAQIENEALKAQLARSGVELRHAVLAEREECASMIFRYIGQTVDMVARRCLASVALDIRARDHLVDGNKKATGPTDGSAA